MREISLQVILRIIFGIDEVERFDQFRSQFMAMQDSLDFVLNLERFMPPLLWQKFHLQKWGGLNPWANFFHRLQKTDQLIYAEIQQRRKQGNVRGNDVLTLLTSARDESGATLTEQELRDFTMDFIVGPQVLPLNLTWTLYWIHHSPEIEDRLRCEIDSLGDQFNPQKICQLPYFNAIFQETLRIYPTNPTFARKLKAPLEIMGHYFEAGTILLLSEYLIHHREDLYSEPYCFKPERFLERKFSRFEYFPFGGGHRGCMGMMFAQMLIKLAIFTILSHFRLVITNRHPLRATHWGLFSMAAPSDLWMVCN